MFELNVCSRSQLLTICPVFALIIVIYMLQWIWTPRKAVKSQNNDFLMI